MRRVTFVVVMALEWRNHVSVEYLFGRLLVESSRWTILSGLCGGRAFLIFISCRLLRHIGTITDDAVAMGLPDCRVAS